MRASSSLTRLAVLGAVLAAPLALGACSTMEEAFGMGKLPPDEYAVAPRRPLAMPPDINLRPPQPGAAALADYSASGLAASSMATAGEGAGAAPASAPAAPPAPISAPPVESAPSDATSTTSGDGTGRVLTTGTPAPTTP